MKPGLEAIPSPETESQRASRTVHGDDPAEQRGRGVAVEVERAVTDQQEIVASPSHDAVADQLVPFPMGEPDVSDMWLVRSGSDLDLVSVQQQGLHALSGNRQTHRLAVPQALPEHLGDGAALGGLGRGGG